LQWLTHVRESDSVTLRENVTRRRIRGDDNERCRCAPGAPCGAGETALAG
jgi:hypothetical protein